MHAPHLVMSENYVHASFNAVMNVSFADQNIEVVEGVGVVSFRLLKTAGAVGPVAVLITTADMTATAGTYVMTNYKYQS